MKKWIIRLLTGLCFAIPMILVSVAFTSASPLPVQNPTDSDQCRVCHASTVEAWENSTHGHAYNDEGFVKVWEEQGQPTECLTCHTTGYDPETNTWAADNITCVACHSEGVEDHPRTPIKINRSSDLCGTCHTDTFFQLSTSMHGETGINCVNCHDPHTNTLKFETAPDLCASCHGNRVSRFAHSDHAAQGLTCEVCHLETNQISDDGHQKSNHTFKVSLDTCTGCHALQIHGPADLSTEELQATQAAPVEVDALHAVEATVVSTTPEPGNPMGFAVVAGLVGMAGGMILSPWLERWYRKLNRKDPDDNGSKDPDDKASEE
jgi:predicted CXXCH cytochrome family protein